MENNIEEKNKENQNIINEVQATEEGLNAFDRKVSMAAKTLDARANDLGRRLEQSLKEFEQTIDMFKNTFEKHDNQNKTFAKELDAFVLLPEKLANNIKDTVPEVGKELSIILSRHIEPWQSLQKQVSNDLVAQQGKFDAMTLKVGEQLNVILAEQQVKLNDLTMRLSKEALEASHTNWKRFLMRLSITAVFAIGISAVTSYLVTVKYPRFIEITGAHDVKVQDSEVKIWGQVKDPKKEETKK